MCTYAHAKIFLLLAGVVIAVYCSQTHGNIVDDDGNIVDDDHVYLPIPHIADVIAHADIERLERDRANEQAREYCVTVISADLLRKLKTTDGQTYLGESFACRYQTDILDDVKRRVADLIEQQNLDYTVHVSYYGLSGPWQVELWRA